MTTKWGSLVAVTALIVATSPTCAVAQARARCDGGKARCVRTLASGLLACHGGAAKSGRAVDSACLQKARNVFTSPAKGCVEKLDAKPPCSSNGASGLESLTEAFVVDVVSNLDPPIALSIKDPCAAGKRKCVSRLVKDLLGCAAGDIKKPDPATLSTCVAKGVARFTTPQKGCFEKLEAKTKFTCAVSGNAAVVRTRAETFVSDVLDAIDPPTPSSIDLTIEPHGGNCGLIQPGLLPPGRLINMDRIQLTCGGLAIGGAATPFGAPESPVPSGTATRFGLTDCAGGICTVVGVADEGLPPGVNGSSAGNGSDVLASVFGGPIPIRHGAPPGCVYPQFASDASGTVNLSTGEMSLNVALNVTAWTTDDSENPCPRCTGYDGIAGPGNPKTGKCDGGGNAKKRCTTVNPEGLSKDCLPCPDQHCNKHPHDGSQRYDPFIVDLSPLTTGPASKADAGGVFCHGDAFHEQAYPGCFGGDPTQCTFITVTGVRAGPFTVGATIPVKLASVFCIPSAGTVVDLGTSLPGPGAVSLNGTLTINH